eukprot:524378-Hanusia_phi.AAC.20
MMQNKESKEKPQTGPCSGGLRRTGPGRIVTSEGYTVVPGSHGATVRSVRQIGAPAPPLDASGQSSKQNSIQRM